MTSRTWTMPALALLGLALVFAPAATAAAEEATWSLEQPAPPPPPPGQPPAPTAVSLGHVGDIEFWEPPGAPPQANRGLLITHGNGDAVPPGVWAYDGTGWHEISEVCGATDGRIAWSGPDEFWTVSDGRPGQAARQGVEQPPLEDNTLCHFAAGRVEASYAHLAFEANSYQAIEGAACLPPQPPSTSSEDCWFGGQPLPAPQIGSFHLNWNGKSVEELPYPNEGHAVRDMRQIETAIVESVSVLPSDRTSVEESLVRAPVLHFAEPGSPFTPLQDELPLYGSPAEPVEALEYLHLGSTEGILWGAAGRNAGVSLEPGEEAGQVTVLRRIAGVWTQLIGPQNPLPAILSDEAEEKRLLSGPARDAAVRAIAPEPGTEDAWLALGPQLGGNGSERETDAEGSPVLVHISAQGQVLGVRVLPTAQERELPSNAGGVVETLVCPAREDCWMATYNGWLYHLAPSGERTLPTSELPGFPEGHVITERPHDEGIPQEVLDAPPPDTSGLREEAPDYGGTFAETKGIPVESTLLAPLLTQLHSRVVHGTTLELRFHLAVKARVRLLAKRHKKVVASTPMRTFAAGNRKLLLRLNRREWPTKLSLQTHALAPLPSTTVKEAVGGPEHGGGGSNTVTTGLTVLPQVPTFAGLGTQPGTQP
jgi:hypothetical protein